MSRQARPTRWLDKELAVCKRIAMARPTPATKKGGAPRKAPNGLSEVLYIRTSPELLESLDALVALEREANPMRSISRADLAREILHRGVEAKKKGSEL